MPSESDFLSSERLEAIGQINGALLRRGGYWIHRRKESVSILDETALQRQVSVDFTLPDVIPGCGREPHVKHPAGGEPVYCPPLFVLPKAPANLMAFDLLDESGVSLPLMTRIDNARVSAATLIELARIVLTDNALNLSAGLEARLRLIASADEPHPTIAAARLARADSQDPNETELIALRSDGAFMWWLRTLAHSSIVVVPYRDPTVRRKIFRLSYQQPITYSLPMTARLGWSTYKVVVDSSWIDARNFHFEAEAPPGLRIVSATLTDDEQPSVRNEGFLRRVHLYRPGAERAGAGTAALSLHVNGQGFVGGALLASGLVLGAVLGCLAEAKHIAENPTSAPALLLLLPALIASYVARPDQHALTTRLLSSARRLLLIAGGAAYISAAFVALNGGASRGAALEHQTDILQGAFRLSGVAALFAFLGLVGTWILSRPRLSRLIRFGWVKPMLGELRRSRFRRSVTVPISAALAFDAVDRGSGDSLGRRRTPARGQVGTSRGAESSSTDSDGQPLGESS